MTDNGDFKILTPFEAAERVRQMHSTPVEIKAKTESPEPGVLTTYLISRRRFLLGELDAIERILGTSPRTAELRKEAE